MNPVCRRRKTIAHVAISCLLLWFLYLSAEAAAITSDDEARFQIIPKATLAPATNLTIFRPPQSPHRNVYMLQATGVDASVLFPKPTTVKNLRQGESGKTKTTTDAQAHPQQQPHGYHLVPTSRQAQDCCYASNGGPYNPDNSPVGTVITESILQHGAFSSADVGFGQTSHDEWILGVLQDKQHAIDLAVTDFVTGLGGWLVFDARNVVAVEPQSSGTTDERAPRTAIGVDDEGRLLLLVADGAEHW